MKVLGITAEYNPFHDGHQYHLAESKRITGADAVVVCMSGNFVQRGEPAVFDKWTRARTAVEKGVDLVLELPTYFALSSAETFARGSVELLSSLDIVDVISFGSEAGSVEPLQRVADSLAEESDAFRDALRAELDRGRGFPEARETALSAVLGKEAAALLEEPNNILGIEYLKAAKRLGTGVPFVTVPRKGESHLMTASVIRRAMRDMEAERRYFDLLTYKIIMSTTEELESTPSGGEGLGNRLHNSIENAENLDELLLLVAAKRYPTSRLRRLCTQSLLGIDAPAIERVPYARVLAFSPAGAKLIRASKKAESAAVPLLTSLSKEAETLAASSADPASFRRSLAADVRAMDLWNLIHNRNRSAYSDYRRTPFHPDRI